MLSKYNWMSLITGVLLVVIALYLFSNPTVPLAILGSTFAVVILLGGVFELVRYFGAPKSGRNVWELWSAIGMVVWSLLMLNSSDSSTILPYFMGLCLLIWTGGRIGAALMLKTIIPGAARHMLFSAWRRCVCYGDDLSPYVLRRGGGMDGCLGTSGDRSGVCG